MTTFNLKHILVPTDFSIASHKALHYAKAFAEISGAKVTLVHVIVSVAAPEVVYGAVPWDLARVQESVSKHLEKLKHQIGFAPTVEVECLVKKGHPFREIADTARELETDLVVIATHGHTGFKHLVLGSVAERVIQHAPCPVLVVREKEHEFIAGD